MRPITQQYRMDLCHPRLVACRSRPYAARPGGPGFQAKAHPGQRLPANCVSGQPGQAGIAHPQLAMGTVVALGDQLANGSQARLSGLGKVYKHDLQRRVYSRRVCHGGGLIPKNPCVAWRKVINLALQPHGGPAMNLTLVTDIKARWAEGQCSYSPTNPEELAIISVDLLVRELGTEAARAFVDQVFERFAQEPRWSPLEPMQAV